MPTILQISDLHFFSNTEKVYNNSNPYQNLVRTVDSILSSNLNIDLAIITGDLSNDYSEKSYDLVKDQISRLNVKYHIIPGNHDDLSVMNKVFNTALTKNSFDYSMRIANWQIYLMDSTVSGQVSGELHNYQLIALERFLLENQNLNCLVFLHHHPIESHSPHMDQYILKDRGLFLDIILKSKNVKGVFFGHIHHVLEKTINNILFASCPSTFYQISCKNMDFSVDHTKPGYRLIHLDNNKLSTNVYFLT